MSSLQDASPRQATRALPAGAPLPRPAPHAGVGPPPALPPVPEESLGQAAVAAVAVFLPFAVALYAVLSAGDTLDAGWKFLIIDGGAWVYGMAMVLLGRTLVRHLSSAAAGSALFVSAGVLGALMASSTWFAPRGVDIYIVLATTVGAVSLTAAGAISHGQLWGTRIKAVLPLLVAVALVALAARGRIVGRLNVTFVDAVAGVLACGVFLRPSGGFDPAGRTVMALALPLGAILVRPFWFLNMFDLCTVAVTTVWSLRALRTRMHDGSIALLGLGLLAAPVAAGTNVFSTRPVVLLVGLGAMLLLARDVERDPAVGPLDEWAPSWLGAGLWLLLAGTVVLDVTAGRGLRATLPDRDVLWFAAVALPWAVPPLVLGHWRRTRSPQGIDLEAARPGLVPEITGWLLMGAATMVAIVTAATSEPSTAAAVSWKVPALAGAAALMAAVWARLHPTWERRILANLLFVASVWVAARWEGSAWTLLAPPVVALLLALSPLMGARRAAGVLGLALFPLLTAESLLREAPVPVVAGLLALFGFVQLIRPPLANLAATRPVGGLSLAAAAWLLVSRSLEGAPGSISLFGWVSDPLATIGLAACLLSLPLLWLAHRRRRATVEGNILDPELPLAEAEVRDPGIVLEATAWVLLAHGMALGLASAPHVRWSSIATLAAVTAVAGVWARLVSTPLRRGAWQLLLLVTLWATGLAANHPWGWLAASIGALALCLSALPALGAHREAGWVGFFVFPIAVIEALVRGAAPLPAALLLAVFGAVHAVRAPLAPSPYPAGAALPALMGAGWLMLQGGGLGPPLLSAGALGAVAALALIPFALWAARPVGGGPVLVILEVLLGAVGLLVVFQQPLVLLSLLLLVHGGSRLGAVPVTPALLLSLAGATPPLLIGAAAVAAYSTTVVAPVVAAATLALAGTLLLRPLPTEVERLRSLGVMAIVAAPLVLLCVPAAAWGGALLGVQHLPLVAAAALMPLALWVLVRGRPSFLVGHTAVLAGATALFGLGAALFHPSASFPAREAAAGALLAFAALMAAAHRMDPFVAPVAWGFAAVGIPLALIPMSNDPWHWPVAAVGMVEVVLLGGAARRRGSPVLAAFSLWLGLLVSGWTAAAFTERLLGGSAVRIVPTAAAAAAIAGALAMGRGSRWLEAPGYFVLPFVRACLTISALLSVGTVMFLPVVSRVDLLLPALAAAALLISAVYIANRERMGWPLILAGGALLLPYVFLRTRTDVFDGLVSGGHGFSPRWDALIAVGAGLLIATLERPLRAQHPAPEPGQLEFPETLPFGVRQVRLVADLVTALSLVALLDLRGPLDALAPLLACALFLWRARRGEPVHGVLAALMFCATVVMLLLDAGVTRLGAYTLPVAAALSLLLHRYRELLGTDEVVRPLPPITAAGICAFEAFFDPPTLIAPALLAGLGLALVLVSRAWRLRSHLHLGLLCLGGAALSGFRAIDDGQLDTFTVDMQAVGLWLLPLASIVASLLATVLTWPMSHMEPADRDVRRSRVRDTLAFSALTAAATVVFVPGTELAEVTLALLAPVALSAAAFTLALRDGASRWLLLAAGALLLPYVYVRVRTGWLDIRLALDALIAVAAGLAAATVERLLRPPPPAPDPDLPPGVIEPQDPAFGVLEVRIVAGFLCALSAAAFFDLDSPRDAAGPALATLYFLARARGGSPIYGVLAVLFIDTTLVMLLLDRGVASPSAYALPLGASLALLLHVYREHLGSEEASVRALVPVATGGVCLYEAIFPASVSGSSLVPSMVLAGLGVVLLVLARLWRLRSHVTIGCGVLAAAVVTLISEWNARGWTTGALAVAAATLLAPVMLLRWRRN